MYHFFNTVPRSTLPMHTYTYLIHVCMCVVHMTCACTHIMYVCVCVPGIHVHQFFHKPGDCLGNSNNNNNDRASALSG